MLGQGSKRVLGGDKDAEPNRVLRLVLVLVRLALPVLPVLDGWMVLYDYRVTKYCCLGSLWVVVTAICVYIYRKVV